MARRPRYKHFVEAAKDEALLACDLYNQHRRPRNLEAFLVHMCIAWVNLMQAVFERDEIDYFYRVDDKPKGKFVRVNGEKKSWGLSESAVRYFADPNNATRQNINFFIGLRNKVEHRLDAKQQAALANIVAGKSQALIRNFEDVLVKEFGAEESLADDLHFPLFLSSLTTAAVEAVKTVKKAIPKGVIAFIDQYDTTAGEAVTSSASYDFRVLLLPKIGNKASADMAIEFINVNTMDEAIRKRFEEALVMVREKNVRISNAGLLKPGEVTARVKALYPKFTANDHTNAWHFFEVRPSSQIADKGRTMVDFCVYDEPHKDYVYTEAWVKKLIGLLNEDVNAPAKWKAELKAGRTSTTLAASAPP